MRKARKQSPVNAPVITLEAGRFYTQDECCLLLRCSRTTLVRYRRNKGFPLREGIALGSDIEEWFKTKSDRPFVPRSALAVK